MSGPVPAVVDWVRDLPDPRDYAPTLDPARALLAPLKKARRDRSPSPPVDWQEYCPPVWDSHGLAAGTALACATLVSYYERRAKGRVFLPSWPFLYKMSRILGNQTGGAATPFRQTLKALARFGLPPLEHGPFDPARADEPPAAFLFSYAREYGDLVYVRLDRPSASPGQVLATVKGFLAAGFAIGFGASLFDTLGPGPEMPFPATGDSTRGGAVFVAIGYDESRRVSSERGALRVRCPWGPAWGDGGYGWLPFRYLTDRLAGDFWTILRPDWLADDEFTRPY